MIFEEGETIAEYNAPEDDIIDQEELEKRYPGDTLAPYAFKITKNRYVDARSSLASVARYANDMLASATTETSMHDSS